jgi:hypothetical protein
MNPEQITQWFPLIIGCTLLLLGWILYWMTIQMAGVFILGGAGLLLADSIGGLFEFKGWELFALQLAGGCLGSAIGVLVARFLHRVVFFIQGTIIGAVVFHVLVTTLRGKTPFEFLGNEFFYAFGIPIVGVLSGFICVVLADYIIILTTSVIGALLVMEQFEWPMEGLIAFGMMLLGGGWQIAISRPLRKKGRERKE